MGPRLREICPKSRGTHATFPTIPVRFQVTLYRAIPQRDPKEMAQLVLKYKKEVFLT